MVGAAGITSLIVYLLIGQVSWAFRASPLTQIFWFLCALLIATSANIINSKENPRARNF
jgi:hypothetical protein